MQRRLFLTGPTASGKGSIAHEIALRIGGEIISVDSMKVYREMDIGTAKPSAERRAQVRHHLIDLIDPSADFSVGEYLPMALAAIEEIESRGKKAILCGGTALYLNAFVHGLFRGPAADWNIRKALDAASDELGTKVLHARLAEKDPQAAGKIHPNDRRRIVRALEVLETTGRPMTVLWRGPSVGMGAENLLLLGIQWDRPELYRRIDERVRRMVRDGLFEEARRLRGRPGGLSRAAAQCIGYKEIFAGDDAGATRDETIAAIQRRTRQFAKQQMTWFRRFPVEWLKPVEAAETILSRLDRV
jgi:tRNA dimethylallyltransferase